MKKGPKKMLSLNNNLAQKSKVEEETFWEDLRRVMRTT